MWFLLDLVMQLTALGITLALGLLGFLIPVLLALGALLLRLVISIVRSIYIAIRDYRMREARKNFQP